MAKTALIMKSLGTPKFSTRRYSRCRLCFRELALKGEVPGITKASW